MPQTVELEPAYVLSQRPYRDTSLLIEVLTPTHGRVGLVARGVRSPKSKLRGLLQPFVPLLLSWQSSGELGALRGAEARGASVALTGERVFFGWYINELMLRLMHRDDPHPVVYAVYDTLLPQLAESATDAEIALRIFEKRLLADIGYALLLPASLDAQTRYRYDWDLGPVPASEGYAGASLIGLREESLEPAEVRRDAKLLLREALRRQLGPRELQSSQLLRRLRAGQGGGADG